MRKETKQHIKGTSTPTHPNAYISTAPSFPRLQYCRYPSGRSLSGADHLSVPLICVVDPIPVAESSMEDIPKSVKTHSCRALMRILLPLISRWMTGGLNVCRYSRAQEIWASYECNLSSNVEAKWLGDTHCVNPICVGIFFQIIEDGSVVQPVAYEPQQRTLGVEGRQDTTQGVDIGMKELIPEYGFMIKVLSSRLKKDSMICQSDIL